MRLNANLLRIAHMFLRDADDSVTILHEDAPEPGVILVASNGYAMIVLRDPEGEIERPCRVRLDKTAVALLRKAPGCVAIDYDGLFEIEEVKIIGRCYVDSGFQILDYQRGLRPILEDIRSSTVANISAEFLTLLSKTALELAAHNGRPKAEASVTLTAASRYAPVLARFGHADAVAVVMPRTDDGVVPTREEIAKWAL